MRYQRASVQNQEEDVRKSRGEEFVPKYLIMAMFDEVVLGADTSLVVIQRSELLRLNVGAGGTVRNQSL